MNRILAIEDNPVHLALITMLMTELGLPPSTAADAEAGLDMMEAALPDAVLCDIRLPTMSGYDLVRLVKSNPATRHLPVIAVTAVGAPNEAKAAGFDGYLAKPVTPQQLRAEIERVAPALRGQFKPPAPAAAEAVAWAKTQLPRTGKRVLVVDDTAGNRELMQVILDHGGYDVACARTVAAAFVTALSWQPHLILCDVNLDRELGAALLSSIKDTPALRDAPFAFTSASPGPSVEADLLAAGAQAYLRFPMKPEDVLREVAKLFEPKPD